MTRWTIAWRDRLSAPSRAPRRVLPTLPALPAVLAALATAAVLAAPLPASAAQDPRTVRGYVDGSEFVRIAGEGAVTVEINLGRSLLRMVCSFDEELCDAIGGLELVQAVILDMSEVSTPARRQKAIEAAEAIDRRLVRQGWERMILIREGDSTVRVLVLPRDQLLEGLVFIGVEGDEVVFTNIAGVIDMEKLGALVDGMDVPGLDEIDLGELERKSKEKKR